MGCKNKTELIEIKVRVVKIKTEVVKNKKASLGGGRWLANARRRESKIIPPYFVFGHLFCFVRCYIFPKRCPTGYICRGWQ